MWFFIGALVILFGIYLFYQARHERPENRGTVSPKDGTRKTGQGREVGEMEVSSDIGLPFEVIDPDKAGQIDRLSGVERPRVRPSSDEEDEELPPSHQRALSTQIYKHGDSLKERILRKDNLSKEVELAWEAGELIQLQPGAWARHKDFPAMMAEIEGKKREKKQLVAETPHSLPRQYGISRLVLMARDPDWVHAYWEITHDKYKELYEKHLNEWSLSKPVLRLHDVTRGVPEETIDVEINDQAQNWYIRVSRPRHTLFAEIGRLFPKGFLPFVKSNEVTIPPGDFSDVVSEEWLPFDWERYRGRMGPSSPWVWRRS